MKIEFKKKKTSYTLLDINKTLPQKNEIKRLVVYFQHVFMHVIENQGEVEFECDALMNENIEMTL